jgi:hypothetical protein
MRILLASALLVAGCASSGANLPYESSRVAVLTVNNERTEDATIYVMHGGSKGRRLGQVNSFESAKYVLTADDAPRAGDVQFLARLTVSGAMEVSDAITAERGASYEWKLGPGRGHQFLSFHYAAP